MTINPEKRFKEQKTYETFERDAKESGLYDTFAKEDLDIAKQDVDYGYRLLSNKKGYVNAKTEENKQAFADQAAFDRAQYQQKKPTAAETLAPVQTSGKQSDASANILSIIKAYDDSLPGDKKSSWMSTIDSIFGQLAGDKFSYDAESDPKYALAQKYAKQAMKAQQAESAMLTGGYGNSYGAAVGQQVYTDYMEDAVTDMEQEAYNRWSAERDNKYNLLNIASQMEQQAYDRARDEENTAYTRAWNEEARDYEREQYAESLASEQEANSRADLLAKAQVLASYGNFSGYKALGYTDDEIASMQQTYDQQADAEAATQAAELAKIYASIEGGEGETTYEPTLTASQAKTAYESGIRTSKVIEAMRYHYGEDFDAEADPVGEIDTAAISQDELDYIFSEKGVPDYFRTTEYFVPFQRFEAERRANGRVAAKFGEVTKYFDDWLEYINAFSDFYAAEDPEDYRY